MAPTLGLMDISLSLRITSNCRLRWPALFIPSKLNLQSLNHLQLSQPLYNLISFDTLPSAIPNAAEIEVDAWPAPIESYLLSLRFKNPLRPLNCLIDEKSLNLPVNSLCAYP